MPEPPQKNQRKDIIMTAKPNKKTKTTRAQGPRPELRISGMSPSPPFSCTHIYKYRSVGPNKALGFEVKAKEDREMGNQVCKYKILHSVNSQNSR